MNGCMQENELLISNQFAFKLKLIENELDELFTQFLSFTIICFNYGKWYYNKDD